MSEYKYKCPLCGHEFNEMGPKCSACPMAGSCHVICCPNCGYSFPAESSIVSWVKRLIKKESDKKEG
jgi:rubredoxin